jgi:uncharacterized protein YgiM (DUF1202 family)
MHAIVKSSRKTDYPNPLKLSEKDVVTILERCSSPGWENWVKCQHRDNIGWVPLNILELTETSTAKIRDAYDATELDVTKGDVFIYNKTFSGWAWGYAKGTSKTGWVPLEILGEI